MDAVNVNIKALENKELFHSRMHLCEFDRKRALDIALKPLIAYATRLSPSDRHKKSPFAGLFLMAERSERISNLPV